ncbi:hypothetical protein HYH03_016847 [Edaphochlamys debaryana]|uniref:Uncharacterized protein n=1 Tax=Edaphochlamys debaryana TaxID=47281 RepID=A0A836BPU0_9CHLO|nr:hypothetical protein HYH03_016847 [Edaphochlamys debaryana]|eukprot:KAG2484302.1 hypothetical protein HYH03_016847 [Edaphochlamys debaryana]
MCRSGTLGSSPSPPDPGMPSPGIPGPGAPGRACSPLYDAAKVEAAGDESVGIDWDSEPAEPEPKLPFIDFSASSWGDMSIEVLIAWKTFTYMAEEDVEAGVADAATYLVLMGAAAPPRGAASNVRALTAFRNNVIRKLAPRVARAFINRGSPASPGSGGSASGSVLCSGPTPPPSNPAASTVAALTGSASAGAPPLASGGPTAHARLRISRRHQSLPALRSCTEGTPKPAVRRPGDAPRPQPRRGQDQPSLSKNRSRDLWGSPAKGLD